MLPVFVTKLLSSDTVSILLAKKEKYAFTGFTKTGKGKENVFGSNELGLISSNAGVASGTNFACKHRA